ncbi:MAG: repair protein RadC, DNA repair protein RadC protein [candidate division WS6 bacterium GW2011_GWC1_33_20]|uniref:Repair protein RadC, DNA repair protein RadC protein n=1 Tax=candidate division WS6 bacterium GW2011_GWC1_33_20 TaxID=1619089 RepID=A0A0F9ZKJ1_9BACT|nr:MAG: repair protein RadC, DNA repair protein RadC protein [candidate division WS6 bacterium GW2011_GWE2_33_157]KKP44718.1 MAG: repair protein RadC, DNA repair protein RadC protein [candidate division WS6 bacterium GW2011_GWC1_33_20]KKP45648.1 MAG: repair protein RadC, DNA repair protein RadC protein [candidate division WS6 bacterium GW2011_GWF1_33_233]KKP55005.1 MAG: repair protein RadC, DNA repair protein RadC protein [candidate division WS6 bacterium GW2011_WS6_33_547]KKP56805.1 MAG: repai
MLPREKLLKRGISVLSDIELVEILVGSGFRGRDFKQISRSVMRVVKKFVRNKQSLDIKDLVKISGIGEVVSMRIVAGIELGRRMYGLFDEDILKITDSEGAYSLLKDMGSLQRERVDIVCLNSRFEYICRESIALGSLNCANLSPREVIYTAVINNSAFVILAHNHPSGDSTPSVEDVTLTKRIQESLDLVGIQLLDHIVIAKKSFNSVIL